MQELFSFRHTPIRRMDGSDGAGEIGSQTTKLGWTTGRTGIPTVPGAKSRSRFTALVRVVPSAWNVLLLLLNSCSFLRTQSKHFFLLVSSE